MKFTENGKHFLVEPTAAIVGEKMPRLSTLHYCPRLSVGWNGANLLYYSHKSSDTHAPLSVLVRFVPEWLAFYGRVWLSVLLRLPLLPMMLYRRQFKNKPSL